MFRHLVKLTRFASLNANFKRLINRKCIIGSLLLSSVHVKADDSANSRNYEATQVETEDLSISNITKMAAVQTVNSASTLLTQSVTVLLDILETYVDLLQTLTKLMELHLAVYGSKLREDKVWDAMMEVRRQLNECQEQKQQLETVYHCAEQALQAAGEAAHITGAEYAGIAANERVYSATIQIQNRQYLVEEAEAKLRQMEVKSIEEISKKNEQAGTIVETEIPIEGDTDQESRKNEDNATGSKMHFDEDNDEDSVEQFYSSDAGNIQHVDLDMEDSNIKVTFDGQEDNEYLNELKYAGEADDEDTIYKY